MENSEDGREEKSFAYVENLSPNSRYNKAFDNEVYQDTTKLTPLQKTSKKNPFLKARSTLNGGRIVQTLPFDFPSGVYEFHTKY